MADTRLFLFSFLFLIAALIFYAATSPQAFLPMSHGLDKLWHFMAFSGLMLGGALFTRSPKALLAVLAVLFAFGVSIEIAQSFVPGRESSALDVAADTAGIIFGFFLGAVMRKNLGLFAIKRVDFA